VSGAFGGWVLDHHAVAAWARVQPYAQALVWSAMEVGMTVVVPAAVLPLAYADTAESDHDVLGELLELPVTVFDPLTAVEAPDLGRVLAGAIDPAALTRDALALAHVVHAASRRGWPVLTGNSAGVRALNSHVDLDELP
jgi:hypothetical protein